MTFIRKKIENILAPRLKGESIQSLDQDLDHIINNQIDTTEKTHDPQGRDGQKLQKQEILGHRHDQCLHDLVPD